MHSSRFFAVSLPLLATVVGVHQLRPVAARGAEGQGLPVQTPTMFAEGAIDLAQERVLFPATIHGDTTTLILDLGTTGNLMSRAEGIRLKIPGAESAETVELDSMTVGSSVRHHIAFEMTDGAFGGAAILMGAPFQAEYDLMFDGPAHRARLYAQPKEAGTHGSSAAKHQAWFPAGITPADCLPMGEDAQGFQRVFFPFQVNGHLVHSMFDSGSSSTNMNAYGARQVGLTVASGHLHLLTFPRGNLGPYPATWEADSAVLTVGGRRLAEDSVTVFRHIPREQQGPGIQDGELSLGLNAVRDRALFVSYSSKLVCFGAPAAGGR